MFLIKNNLNFNFYHCGLFNSGTAVGLSNWLRVTFAVDLASLQDGLLRLKNFCSTHSKL